MRNLNVTHLVSQIERLVANSNGIKETGIDSRKRMLAALIGAVIGTTLPLPSARVDSPRAYYSTNVYPEVSDYVTTINANYPIDIELVVETAFSIWYERYVLVHAQELSSRKLLQRLIENKDAGQFVYEDDIYDDISCLNDEEAAKLDNVFAALRSAIKEQGV